MGKVYNQRLFSVTRDNVLNFGILCTKNPLFSSNLENDTDVIFVTCNGLTNEKEALINSKIY